METREGRAHRGDFIPGARAGPGQPQKLRSGDPGGRFPWHFVSESHGKLSLCGSRGGESYGLTRARAGGTVSVVWRPIFHGKVNKANGICLCLEPSPAGAPHPQAASHWPTVLGTWVFVNAPPQIMDSVLVPFSPPPPLHKPSLSRPALDGAPRPPPSLGSWQQGPRGLSSLPPSLGYGPGTRGRAELTWLPWTCGSRGHISYPITI